MVRGYGKGKFKSDKQRRAVMSQFNNGNKKQLNKGYRLKKTIPKSPNKSYDTGYTVHDTNMAELKKNKVSVFVDGEGNIISYGYQHEGKTIQLPNTGYEKQREEIYTKKSVQHPAKMDTQLSQSLIQEYSKPGDLIYDPMAGIGTTGIESSRLGRDAVISDIEPKWTKEAKKNKQLLKKEGEYNGNIHIHTGDSRKYELKKKADVIITSPPFEDVLWGDKSHYKNEDWKNTGMYSTKSSYSYGKEKEGQLGNIKGEEHYKITKEIYEQCYKNLKKDGVMIVHTKNFVRQGKEVRMDDKTREIMEESGFKFVEKRRRKITRPSFFKIQYERKHPEGPKIHYENLLIFKK